MTIALLRPLAEADLVERTHYYRREGGDSLGERFFDAAVAAVDAITRMPGAGSPRVGELCGWFYFVADDHVDIVRLLADAQDLPAILVDVPHE